MKQATYDVFISYSRKDYMDENQNIIPGNVVSIIKDTLSKEGISYWFDEEGMYSGQNFVEKIVSNIEASKMFVFLSTAKANDSKWTCKEIASADEFGKHIIPVRLDPTPYNKKVLFRIADLDYIEYYTNPEKGLRDLVDAIKAYLAQLEEEEKRKAEEEKKKREAEKKKKEDEKARKELEEKRRKEEQLLIIAEIKATCERLNNEEKKNELDRKTLLASIERVSDAKVKEDLKAYIEESSPARQTQHNELDRLQKTIDELRHEIDTLTAKKDELALHSENKSAEIQSLTQELEKVTALLSKTEKERDNYQSQLQTQSSAVNEAFFNRTRTFCIAIIVLTSLLVILGPVSYLFTIILSVGTLVYSIYFLTELNKSKKNDTDTSHYSAFK